MADFPPRFKALGLDEEKWLKNYETKIVPFFINRSYLAFLPRSGWLQQGLMTDELWPAKVNNVSDVAHFLNCAARRVHGKRRNIWAKRSSAGHDGHDGVGLSKKVQAEERVSLLTVPCPLPESILIEVATVFNAKEEIFGLRKLSCRAWPTRLKADDFAKLCNSALSAHFPEYSSEFPAPAFIPEDNITLGLGNDLVGVLQSRDARLDEWFQDLRQKKTSDEKVPQETAEAEAETAEVDAAERSERSECSDHSEHSEPYAFGASGLAMESSSASDTPQSKAGRQLTPDSSSEGLWTSGRGVGGLERMRVASPARNPRLRPTSVPTRRGRDSESRTPESQPGWQTSGIKRLNFRPKINIPSAVLETFRNMAPVHLTNFPIEDEPALRNYLLHSMYHRIDMHVRAVREGGDNPFPTLKWFGVDDETDETDEQEVFLILANSQMIPRHDPDSSLLLVLVPDLSKGSESDLDNLLVRRVLSSADLASEWRSKNMVQESIKELPVSSSELDGCTFALEEDGRPSPPFCFEGAAVEDMNFDQMAYVNDTGVATHIQSNDRWDRVPIEFDSLSPADCKQRVQWAISRARRSRHVAVPQYFTDKNSTEGGAINWLLPLSFGEPGSDDAHAALVLVPQKSRSGKKFYLAMTVLSLERAWLNALVINPFSGHWLRRA